MSEKIITSRIQQKHDLKSNWDKATNFNPKSGEIIVYDDLHRLKIGDGTTVVSGLKFTSDIPESLVYRMPIKTYLVHRGYVVTITTEPGMTIDWGDGSEQSFTSSEEVTHSYDSGDISNHIITIGGAVTSFNNKNFKGNTIVEAYIGNRITTLGDFVFQGCNKLAKVIFQDGLTTIGSNVFEGCTSLKEITFPKTLTTTGDDILSGCTGFETVTFESSLTAAGHILFGDATPSNLKTLYMNGPTVSAYIRGAELFSKIIVPQDLYSGYFNDTEWTDLFAKLRFYPDNNELESSYARLYEDNQLSGTNTFVGSANFQGSTTFTGTNIFANSTLEINDGKDKTDDGKAVIFSPSSMKLYDGWGGRNYTINFPTYEKGNGSTLATTNDIDVTAAGNNAFTGMNSFSSVITAKQGIVFTNGNNFMDNASLKYNSILRYTNNTTYTLTLPVKTGTLAITDDVTLYSHKTILIASTGTLIANSISHTSDNYTLTNANLEKIAQGFVGGKWYANSSGKSYIASYATWNSSTNSITVTYYDYENKNTEQTVQVSVLVMSMDSVKTIP